MIDLTDLYWNTDYVHQISNDAGRSMMGSRQENWFYEQLIGSAKRNATWRVIGSRLSFHVSTNPFPWQCQPAGL
jgi:alkaline phosphatase D